MRIPTMAIRLPRPFAAPDGNNVYGLTPASGTIKTSRYRWSIRLDARYIANLFTANKIVLVCGLLYFQFVQPFANHQSSADPFGLTAILVAEGIAMA